MAMIADELQQQPPVLLLEYPLYCVPLIHAYMVCIMRVFSTIYSETLRDGYTALGLCVLCCAMVCIQCHQLTQISIAQQCRPAEVHS